jgi:hypothetical protein
VLSNPDSVARVDSSRLPPTVSVRNVVGVERVERSEAVRDDDSADIDAGAGDDIAGMMPVGKGNIIGDIEPPAGAVGSES